MLSEDPRMRHSFPSRLLYFGIDLFRCVPLWPNQQQIGPHARPYLIARNHDGGTWSFVWGGLARGSNGIFQFLGFPAENGEKKAGLTKSILDGAPPPKTAIARLQINAGAARLWRGARLHK